MNESEQVERKQKKNPSPPRGEPRKKSLRRPFEERLRAVKLHLEEGFTQGIGGVGSHLGRISTFDI